MNKNLPRRSRPRKPARFGDFLGATFVDATVWEDFCAKILGRLSWTRPSGKIFVLQRACGSGVRSVPALQNALKRADGLRAQSEALLGAAREQRIRRGYVRAGAGPSGLPSAMILTPYRSPRQVRRNSSRGICDRGRPQNADPGRTTSAPSRGKGLSIRGTLHTHSAQVPERRRTATP